METDKNTDTKDYVIGKTEDNGETIYWQTGRFWGRHLPDAGSHTLKECRVHEEKFLAGGVHKVFIVDKRTMTIMPTPAPKVSKEATKIFHLVRRLDLKYDFQGTDSVIFEIIKSSLNREVLQKIIDETPEKEDDDLTDENHPDTMLSPVLSIEEGDLV